MLENLKQKEGIDQRTRIKTKGSNLGAMLENPKQNEGIESRRDAGEPEIKKKGIESRRDAREH